jgi:AcrR family transcriptional regulator
MEGPEDADRGPDDGGGGRRREPTEFPISGYGRQRLLDTALSLFDEHGLDGVSARAIAQASGHRNVAAVNYHFGSRDELIRAVIGRGAEDLDRRRHHLLDELEAAGPVAPRAALVAVVTPIVDLLDAPDGRRYVRLLNQAANHPAYFREANLAYRTSLARGAAHLLPVVAHLEPARQQLRAQNILGLVLYALAQQARLIDSGAAPDSLLDTATFQTDLVDAIMGALAA